MIVADLLAEHSLQLRLQTPSTAERLRHEVTSCAPTEMMDPTPFLRPNTLLVTSGIGLNFQEAKTWDAYVERLARVPVSAIAFASGPAHRILPGGLVAACRSHGMPLLEVPSTVPPLQVDRHVESVLQAERFEIVNRGWVLADECARLANHGAEVSTLLAAIFEATGAPVAVYDAFGSVISQYPEFVTWAESPGSAPLLKPVAGVSQIPLPMGVNRPCHLAVRETEQGEPLKTLLGPVASIVALQLGRSIAIDADRTRQIRQLVSQCGNWEGASLSDIERSCDKLGLNRATSTYVFVADMSGELQSNSWRIRVALHEAFSNVCLAEYDARLYALCQDPRENDEDIADRVLGIDSAQPVVLGAQTLSPEELRLAVVHAEDLVCRVKNPVLAPELGLGAVVAATAGRGARRIAERFLAPLSSSTLLPTLRAYLGNDAQVTRTCEELFIHRNTLSYRIRKIESLLRVDLSTVDAQATCLLALRLIDAPAR